MTGAFLGQPPRLRRREAVAPIADDAFANERRHVGGARARPAFLVAAHLLEPAVAHDALEAACIAREAARAAAPEIRERARRGRRRPEHSLVSQEQHVRIPAVRPPRAQVLEVVAEIDLAAYEALEERIPGAFCEVVVPRKTARVVKERDGAVER